MNGIQIVIKDEDKKKLDKLKQYPRDTYGDIVGRLIQEHEKVVSPELTEKEIKKSAEDVLEYAVEIISSPEEEKFTEAEATTQTSAGM